VYAKCCFFIFLLALSGAAAFSAEEAVLRNGSAITPDHRETYGEFTRRSRQSRFTIQRERQRKIILFQVLFRLRGQTPGSVMPHDN
jgi:hypothetical protein